MNSSNSEDNSFDWLQDEAKPTKSTRPKLGSLGQSARLKELKTARWIFILVGLLTIGVNGFVFFQMPAMVDAEIKKEVAALTGRGMIIDQVKLKELREAAIRSGQLVAGGFLVVGIVYLIFAAVVEKYPVPITISGLVIYIAGAAITGMFDPATLLQGWLVKILIVIGLVKAIQAAIAYERRRKEEGQPAAEFA